MRVELEDCDEKELVTIDPPLDLSPLFFENIPREIPLAAVERNDQPPKVSCLYQIAGHREKTARIGFINGMNSDPEKSKKYALHVQSFTDRPTWAIEGVYNATHGLVLDSLEGLLNAMGHSPHTAVLLASNWKLFHEENLDCLNAKYLQVCHSQGVAHVRNALKDTPSAIRDRIIVLAIAPTLVIPKELCFAFYGYGSEKDLVCKFNDHITLLESRGTEANDHNFDSETFWQVLQSHITEYSLFSP